MNKNWCFKYQRIDNGLQHVHELNSTTTRKRWIWKANSENLVFHFAGRLFPQSLNLTFRTCLSGQSILEQKMGDKRIKPPCFRLEFPGDKDAKLHVYERLQKVREHLTKLRNRPVNNYDILDYSLNCFQEKHGKQTIKKPTMICREIDPSSQAMVFESVFHYLHTMSHRSKLRDHYYAYPPLALMT